MFKRRHELIWYEKLREWVWPRAGWQRMGRYIGHRLQRISDSPYRVAAGLACGTAISFTPFMGFHLMLAMAMAFALRANIVASAIGTLIGNPWTFPFIWVLIYRLGMALLGAEPAVPLSQQIDTDRLLTEPWEAIGPVLGPMVVGGLPIAFSVWFLTYWPAYSLIGRYQARRAHKFGKLDRRKSSRGRRAGDR
jgi:uncharacterized protein (DUF2062 family)